MGKVLQWNEIESELSPLRNQKKIVFTNGCFDILHIGHVKYLQEARACGDLLFIGINSDQSVQILKGPTRPIQNQSDRAEILAALACVDYVCVFNEETPLKLIESVKPQILVKGGDWHIEKIVGAEFVMSLGGSVKSLQFVDGRSTTNIIRKIGPGT